jgi:hypothetical protein
MYRKAKFTYVFEIKLESYRIEIERMRTLYSTLHMCVFIFITRVIFIGYKEGSERSKQL